MFRNDRRKVRVILLTGGSTGIGYELALLLMERGMRVYAASRRGSLAQKSGTGGEIIPVQMDVNKEDQVLEVINRIIRENDYLDAVICNAGNGIAGAVEDFSEDEVREQFETNFFGAVRTIQRCLPLFRKQGFGKIMVTSSLAARIPIPYQAFYSASKSALSIFMQALALEVKPFGIQCCTVFPGDTKTDFTQSRKYCVHSRLAVSAYSDRMNKAVSRMEADERKGMEARRVAGLMARQLERDSMNITVIPGAGYKVINWLYGLLPESVSLWIVGKIY